MLQNKCFKNNGMLHIRGNELKHSHNVGESITQLNCTLCNVI